MLMNGWIATHFKAEQDRVGSWEERYWQCVTIDWNCIEFDNLLELGREESGGEDAGQWIVASFGELNFLHRTKLEWFHDIKLLHCLSLIIDSSTKACRTGEAWGERSSLELGDNGHFMVGPGMFAEKCSQVWLAMMWKRIYCDKIYELAHDGEGHGKDEKKEKKYIQNVDLAVKTNLVWLERGLGRDQKDIDRVDCPCCEKESNMTKWMKWHMKRGGFGGDK